MTKKVYLVCATGIATSTMLRVKLEDYLKDHDIPATLYQYRVAELNPSRLDADLIISTTTIPEEIHSLVPVLDGIPLITGQGEAETLRQILKILQQQ